MATTRTSWQGGIASPNPGGRPRDREIAALARRYTPDVIRTLVDVCRNATDNPSARVAAANALADRGWGKPRQEVDLGAGAGIGQALHLHLYAVQRLEQAQAVAAALEAPPIEGTVEEYADVLLETPPLPEEALELWDFAAIAKGGSDAPPASEAGSAEPSARSEE